MNRMGYSDQKDPLTDNDFHELFYSGRGSIFDIHEKRYQFFMSLIHTLRKNQYKGYLASELLEKEIGIFLGNQPTGDLIQVMYQCIKTFQRDEQRQSVFPVLSLTRSCAPGKVDGDVFAEGKFITYHTACRFINDTRQTFGNHFLVIHGDEPFLYKDSEKTLLHIFEEFNDLLFIVITNGPIIDEELAQRLVQLGNVVPTIFVEGFERETDARRGAGEHAKILRAMENLREAGLAFGLMVPVTDKNTGVLLDDFFYDYYFEEQGASFMLQSQPTLGSESTGECRQGAAKHLQPQPVPGPGDRESTVLLPAPEKQTTLYRMWDHLMKDKNYCVAEFWHSAMTESGPIAGNPSFGRIFLP